MRRARVLALLRQGCSILDTVEDAGYFDQPHLTRALKRWVGHTPAQVTCRASCAGVWLYPHLHRPLVRVLRLGRDIPALSSILRYNLPTHSRRGDLPCHVRQLISARWCRSVS